MKNILKHFPNKIVLVCLLYTFLILKFAITSVPIQMSANPSTNRFLNLMMVVLIGAIGIAAVYLLRMILNLGIFEKQPVRIFFIILVALLPRILWLSIVDIKPDSDFALYNSLAHAFSRGEDAGGKYVALFPHTFGYPFILGLVYSMFSTSKYWAFALNILFEIGTAVLVYLTGKRISNWKAGFIAAIAWAAWASHIFYSALINTESLYTFLMILIIYAYFRVLPRKGRPLCSYGFYFALGALCAITNAIRPLATVLMIAIAIMEVSRVLKRKNGHISALTSLAALFAAYFAFSTIIGMYVSHRIGYDIAKSPLGFNTYVGSNVDSTGMWNQDDAQVLSDMMHEEEFSAQKIHDLLFEEALLRLRRQGIGYFRLAYNKNKIMWDRDDEIVTYLLAGNNSESTQTILKVDRYPNRLKFICNYYYYVFLILAFLGVLLLYKIDISNEITFLLLMFMGIGATHTIVEVHGRYHYSAMLIICILAGVAAGYGSVKPALESSQKPELF